MNKAKSPKGTPWTPPAVRRIQGGFSKKSGGKVTKGSWVAEVQSKVAKRTS
jgi:hypothetical protein